MPIPDFAYETDILDRASISRLIRGFWASRLDNSKDAVELFCTDNITFSVAGNASSSIGPLTCTGKQSVISVMRNIDINLRFIYFDIVDLVIDGHEAALRWYGCFEHRGTGAIGCFSVFDHITIRDGLIDSYSEFLDTDGFNKLIAGHAQPIRGRQSNSLPCNSPANDDIACVDRAGVTQVDFFQRNRRVRLLRDYWDDRMARGSAAMPDYFTQDCELHFVGDAVAIPFARFHQGIKAACRLTDLIDVEFEYISFKIQRILVDGDRAAVHWTGHVRHRGTSAKGFIASLDHVIFRGDRIFSVTKFFDTAGTVRWIEG